MAKKKSKIMLSSYTIILILIFGLGILSHILPDAQFDGKTIVNGSGTVGAKLSDVLMSPILGFEDAVDVSIFIMILSTVTSIGFIIKNLNDEKNIQNKSENMQLVVKEENEFIQEKRKK